MAFRIRFLVLILTTLCLSSICGNVVLLNFTKICMRAKVDGNFTSNSSRVHFLWTDTHENTLLSAPAWGAFVSALPIGWCMHKFGLKRIFVTLGFLSALATCVMPLSVFLAEKPAFYVILVCRVLQGVSLGSCLPCVASVTTQWAPVSEHGLFLGVAGGFVQIGPFMTNPVAGLFCGGSLSTDWTMVYWIFGILSTILFILWFLSYHDNPNDHPLVKPTELMAIIKGKIIHNKNSVPVKSMLTSTAVWAILITSVASMSTMQLLIIYTPTYFMHALKFDPYKTGFLATLPTLIQFLVKVGVGVVSDRVKCCNETVKVKVFNSIGLFGTAALLLVLSFIGIQRYIAASFLIIFATGVLGFHSGGFTKSGSLVAGQYSTFVYACFQVLFCVCSAAVPFVVTGVMSSDQFGNEKKWRNTFLLFSGILALGNSVFCFFGSGVAAEWTKNCNKTGYGSANGRNMTATDV